jgi:hypothetical protein
MSRRGLAAIGWKSLRLRVSMADGAWAYVEEAARASGLTVRQMVPVLIGRGLDYTRELGGPGFHASATEDRDLDGFWSDLDKSLP